MTEVVRPDDADQWSWLPFPTGHERYTYGWWDGGYRFHYTDGRRWFVAHRGGLEVGRVEVDVASGDDYYVGSAVLGNGPILDIEFVDVATDQRRQGIASKMVQHLMDVFPGHRLVAFSEDADEFWGSLGWTRIEHPGGSDHYRPLFVQQD